MTVNILSAAKHMAHQSNWTLSNLQLQKLIYLAHMFHLGRNSEPLVHGFFEAWDYGPVHPELYHKVKMFGSNPVGNIFHYHDDLPEGPEQEILDEAYASLGSARPGVLVNATHKKGGAWDINYIAGARRIIITNDDILSEYVQMDDAA